MISGCVAWPISVCVIRVAKKKKRLILCTSRTKNWDRVGLIVSYLLNGRKQNIGRDKQRAPFKVSFFFFAIPKEISQRKRLIKLVHSLLINVRRKEHCKNKWHVFLCWVVVFGGGSALIRHYGLKTESVYIGLINIMIILSLFFHFFIVFSSRQRNEKGSAGPAEHFSGYNCRALRWLA